MSDEPWYMNPKEAWKIIITADSHGYDTRTVGVDRVTSLKRVPREGMHSSIPYIEVWRGNELTEEFCQHALVGVLWTDTTCHQDDTPF